MLTSIVRYWRGFTLSNSVPRSRKLYHTIEFDAQCHVSLHYQSNQRGKGHRAKPRHTYNRNHDAQTYTEALCERRNVRRAERFARGGELGR